MPIHQTIDPTTVDLSLFYDADMVRVGEAFARLDVFRNGDTALDVFTCDAGTLASLKRAAARIVGIAHDKTTTVRYVQRSKDGRKVWKRLAKDATTKANDVTREGIVRSYSSDAIREGVRKLRESQGVAIKRMATLADDSVMVALVRSNNPNDATEENDNS